MSERIFTTRDGDTVPLILWISLKRDDDKAEEELYDLNPWLKRYSAILPKGLNVKIPELSATKSVKRRVVQVWD